MARVLRFSEAALQLGMNTTHTQPAKPVFSLETTEALITFAQRHLLRRLAGSYGEALICTKTKDGETFDINEMMLVALLAEDMLVVHEPKLSVFFTYENVTGRWVRITSAKLKLCFDDLIRRLAASMTLTLEDVSKLCRNRKFSDLISMLQGYVEDPTIFSRREMAIHLINGMLKWSDGGFTLTEFHPSYYSRNQCRIAFDPHAECPRFLSFLEGALPDRNDHSILQMLAGQWLLGANITQRMVIFRGKAKTGKSTLMAIFRKIIGQENATELRTRHLNERFEMNNYLDKSLLIGSDVPGDFLCNKGSDALKKLTGDDLITIERKYGPEMREIIGNFNVGVTSNNRLRVGLEGDADAWRRRLVIFDFLNAPSEKTISNFAEILVAEEGQGILRWMIEGAACLLRLNDKHESLPLSAAQWGRVDGLLNESDSLAQFVRSNLHLGEGDVTTSEVVERYCRHCLENGWAPHPSAERQLRSLIMDAHNIAQSHDIKRGHNTVRGYRNLILK